MPHWTEKKKTDDVDRTSPIISTIFLLGTVQVQESLQFGLPKTHGCWIPKNISFGLWSNIRGHQPTFHSYIINMPSKISIKPYERMMAFQASRGTPRNSSGWTSVCSSSSEDARRAMCSITGLRNARISLWPPSIRKHLNMQIHATYRYIYDVTSTYIPMDILIIAGIFVYSRYCIHLCTSTWRVGAWPLFCVSPSVSWPELEPGNCHQHRWGAIGLARREISRPVKPGD